MIRRAAIGLASIVLAFCGALAGPTGEPGSAPHLLFGDAYPLEVSVSFHAALFHWVDSLAHMNGPGMTAGKTVEAHRKEFYRVHGDPSSADLRMLQAFADARIAFAKTHSGEERHALTLAFFEAENLDAALARAAELVGPDHAPPLAGAMRHFAARYRSIWRDGRIPHAFLKRTRGSDIRHALERFMTRLTRFYSVAPERKLPPRLVLTPVRRGFGTHAQAIGRYLLIEVREREDLRDEVAPIVHENVHFLFHRIPQERIARLHEIATAAGPAGVEAWNLLAEALPTAIAQGVADETFGREGWSQAAPWYHTRPVDAYAKILYPIVKDALSKGGKFDAEFLKSAITAHD